MKLDLQFGYGMMAHSLALLSKWNGGRAILSPRDLTCGQLEKMSEKLTSLRGGQVWLDPQFYVPHADHERLCSHAYWPKDFETGLFWQGQPLANLLTELHALNTSLKTSGFVLPGMLAGSIDDDWFGAQEAVLSQAAQLRSQIPLVCTIALSGDAVRQIDQMTDLLERAENWRVNEFYIVAQHPSESYYVEDEVWLSNLLDLLAGLKLMKRKVTLGYSQHQMLIAALTKTDSVASGTYVNVRSFPPDKFVVPEDDEIKQKSVWYYCPQALSEYQIPALDLAFKNGVLDRMRAPASLSSGYADKLFSGLQPSSTDFNEQDAFRHYLTSFRRQAERLAGSSFVEVVDAHSSSLDKAEKLLEMLTKSGVRGKQRDYKKCLETDRAASASLVSSRGKMLERYWDKI